jgi:apolipoprotein N-acyltransferase
MLVNLTNDAWFGDTTEPWIHLALAQMRAVEHRMYLLRATNSGVSAVIDPVGRVIAHGGTFRAEALDAVAHWMKHGKTGYELWGDFPWWVAAVAVSVMAFRKRRAS